jgi:hypothetical protein
LRILVMEPGVSFDLVGLTKAVHDALAAQGAQMIEVAVEKVRATSIWR